MLQFDLFSINTSEAQRARQGYKVSVLDKWDTGETDVTSPGILF